MLDCVTEQSFGVYRWTFDRMLPALPTVGTPHFGKLVKELQPYGISPGGVFIEAPTPQLGDVSLRILLLEGQRASLRFSFDLFELAIDYLSEGDDVTFPLILKAVFDVLRELDPESQSGRALLTFRAHLSLQSQEPEAFLSEHIRPPLNQERLIPRIVHYNIALDEGPATSMRIGITRSLAFEKALFVELVGEYHGPPEPEEAAERFAKDAKTVFELVGLNPKSKGVK